MKKAMLNEKGQAVVTLSDGLRVKLRAPKGRDLKLMEIANNAADNSQVGTMMLVISLLTVEPKLTLDQVEDLDGEDVKALGDALSNFRIFSNLG